MQKKTAVSIPLFTLILSTLTFSLVTTTTEADPDELHVGPGQTFSTIQAAINAANHGDTIIAHASTYTEQVVINKTLTIKGESGAKIEPPKTRNTYTITESANTFEPIIFAYGGTESVGAVSGSGTISVTLTGFEIDGRNNASASPTYIGVLYRNVNPGIISNNIIYNMYDSDEAGDGPQTIGIVVYGDSNVTVEENEVSEFSRLGIGALGDDGPQPDPLTAISRNNVIGNGLEVASGWWAENGIQISLGAGGAIVGNNVSDCQVNNPSWASSGILPRDQVGGMIEVLDNKVANCDVGIYVDTGSFVLIDGNTVSGSNWDGITLGYVNNNNCTVTNNILYNNPVGIGVYDSSENTIGYNMVRDNDYGIYMDGASHNNEIFANDVLNNTVYGIYVGPYGVDPSGTKAYYNNIEGNGGYGLNKDGSENVTASFNWWGDPTGPYHPTNPTGLGDNVSDNVYFAHYLDQPFLTPTTYIDPSPIQKAYSDVCTYFNVSVTIENVTDLFGFDFNITWDNSLITFSHCYYNETLNEIWGVDNWFAAKNETGVGADGTGWFKFAAVSTSSNFSTTGSQALFNVEFHVEDPLSNTVREANIQFATHKLSNPFWTPIPHTTQDGTYNITGVKPGLQMTPSSIACRRYGQSFTIEVNVTDVFNVTNFEFEIHYNTTLLDYVNLTWNAWGSGALILTEVDGNLTGSTSGTKMTGNLTLISIKFQAAYHHIWKDESQVSGWTNDLTGTIYIQRASLSYSGARDVEYEKGTSFDINIDPVEVDYTFSPIRGDINNDGDVDIFDLRTVALYYDEIHDPYDLNGDGTIDIFDLVIIATNYGFEYSP